MSESWLAFITVHRFPAPGAHDIAHLNGQPVSTIEGRVIDFPTTRWSQTRFILEGTAGSNRSNFHGVHTGDARLSAVGFSAGRNGFRVHGWLSLPKPPSRSHSFDEEGYWASLGVYSLLRVWFPLRVWSACRPRSRDGISVYQAWRFRQRFEDFWETRLTSDDSALLLGITLGARGRIARRV